MVMEQLNLKNLSNWCLPRISSRSAYIAYQLGLIGLILMAVYFLSDSVIHDSALN